MSPRYQVPAVAVPAAGQRALLEPEGHSIALFNIDGQFYAIADSCPHQGASLSGGQLQGRVVQCCAHGLRFDLVSGYLLNSDKLKVTTYPVEKDDDRLYIVIEDSVP